MIDAPAANRVSTYDASAPVQRVRTATSRVAIVDDQPIVRRGLAALFSRQPDFELCGEAGTFTEGLQACRQYRPKVVILEIVMREGSGLELIRELTAADDDVAVLVCSMHDETLYAERALRAGAKGFISKFEPAEKIVDAARRILGGRVYLSDQMTDRMLCRSVGSPADADKNPIESLSDRELEVFVQVGHGVTTRQIAENLHLSPKTIETYRENIKAKLNLRNGMELTQHAVKWVLEQKPLPVH